MNIRWLDNKEKTSIVTIYKTTITFNVSAMKYFETAFRVRVGINENDEILFSPIDKSTALRGEINEDQLFKFESRNTFLRISNKVLTKLISEQLNLDFYLEPIKFNAIWDEKNNVLILKGRDK